jgi:hypothetical protein
MVTSVQIVKAMCDIVHKHVVCLYQVDDNKETAEQMAPNEVTNEQPDTVDDPAQL